MITVNMKCRYPNTTKKVFSNRICLSKNNKLRLSQHPQSKDPPVRLNTLEWSTIHKLTTQSCKNSSNERLSSNSSREQSIRKSSPLFRRRLRNQLCQILFDTTHPVISIGWSVASPDNTVVQTVGYPNVEARKKTTKSLRKHLRWALKSVVAILKSLSHSAARKAHKFKASLKQLRKQVLRRTRNTFHKSEGILKYRPNDGLTNFRNHRSSRCPKKQKSFETPSRPSKVKKSLTRSEIGTIQDPTGDPPRLQTHPVIRNLIKMAPILTFVKVCASLHKVCCRQPVISLILC